MKLITVLFLLLTLITALFYFDLPYKVIEFVQPNEFVTHLILGEPTYTPKGSPFSLEGAQKAYIYEIQKRRYFIRLYLHFNATGDCIHAWSIKYYYITGGERLGEMGGKD